MSKKNKHLENVLNCHKNNAKRLNDTQNSIHIIMPTRVTSLFVAKHLNFGLILRIQANFAISWQNVFANVCTLMTANTF